jgi:hypothetical protein
MDILERLTELREEFVPVKAHPRIGESDAPRGSHRIEGTGEERTRRRQRLFSAPAAFLEDSRSTLQSRSLASYLRRCRLTQCPEQVPQMKAALQALLADRFLHRAVSKDKYRKSFFSVNGAGIVLRRDPHLAYSSEWASRN